MRTRLFIAAAACGLTSLSLQAQETKLTWGGYAKLDVLFSRFSEGEVPQSTSRDFYVPGTIPVSAGTGDSYSVLDLHAKETRLFVKTETDFGEEVGRIGSYIEFDFISGVVSGNEIVTNAYNPVLRRAYISYGHWLLGQDWTNFQNLGSIPDTLDFVAWPSEGTVFARQPQLRYTAGGFAIALENRETTVLPNGGGVAMATGDGLVPDVTARFSFKAGSAELALALLARQLSIDNLGGPDDDQFGGGASLSGKIGLGKDDIRFMLTGGEGIGRYVALGTSTDAVLNANGELEALGLAAGFVAYRHVWSEKWRSTVTVSVFQADNDTALTGTGVTKSVQSASVNLLYSPVPKITFGGEVRRAEREIESGADGSLDRLQFSAKYLF